jgi:Cd2+/Zn2+-exporting ATPase
LSDKKEIRPGRGIFWKLSHYQEFLLDPGTLFTLASGALLAIAIIQRPDGLFSSGSPEGSGTYFYLAAAIVGSLFIWWSAIQGIRERDFTADIPVSIATAAAIFIGQYSAAAVVAVLLLTGGLLEELVAARSGRAMEALAGLLPDRVTVRKDSSDEVMPLRDIRAGDILLMRSGERIAVDGQIVSGTASVNQATITGESMPVEKKKGDAVFAGTLLEVGAIELLATKVGEETTLGKIRRMIEEARSQKPPIERLLDGYAKVYTPIALIMGGLLWWWTGDVLRAITVLIVFCPCVMVLATPTALVASIGNAALRGSLIKKGVTVEEMSKVDTVVFDKTGTLTKGKPGLVEVTPLGTLSEAEIIGLAAIAEKFSEHPTGKAVTDYAARLTITVPDPDEFETLPGLGVKAKAGGHEVMVGRRKMMEESGLSIPGEAEKESNSGRSIVLVAIDSRIAGMLAFEDELRPESKAAVLRLKEMGQRIVMVTGDNRATAERMAEKLGIGEVYAEVLPQEKVGIVKKLQAEGRHVAFVGDGVNDGPALATADVGIAMGLTGTDVAIETADAGLLSDDLSRLPHLFVISRKSIATIKQNVAFAVGVLALAVVLTVLGILSPVTGALLHELSSIPVIINSARLITYEPGKTKSNNGK